MQVLFPAGDRATQAWFDGVVKTRGLPERHAPWTNDAAPDELHALLVVAPDFEFEIEPGEVVVSVASSFVEFTHDPLSDERLPTQHGVVLERDVDEAHQHRRIVTSTALQDWARVVWSGS